jgi:uncharacterized protein (TIGR02453 family)
MAFTGFGTGAIGFYEDLAENNSREWWLANKKRYEDEVRRPMEQLLEDLSGTWGEAKLFRPNRDTRFAKDKTPYKTNIAAVIFGDGGGSVYLSLSAEGLHIGGGGYHLDRPQLARYRQAVARDATGAELESIADALREARADVASHGELKRAPKGFSPDHPRIDLLKRDGIIGIWAHPPRKWLSTPKAKARVEDAWTLLRPLNDWMVENVGPSTEGWG